jgi:hypothetical protein
MSSLLANSVKGVKEFDVHEQQYGKTIGIHSPKRTGKTLTMVFLIVYYMDLLGDWVKGVISNLDLYMDNYIPLIDIKMIGRDEYKNYIIATDEFRGLCDSRMSGAFKNLFISNILRDTGKFKQIHILTDQDSHAIDRRIRVNADAVLRPLVDRDTGVCTVKVCPNYRTYFYIEGMDLWDEWDSEFYIEDYPSLFKYYNTEQKLADYVLTFTPEDFYVDFMKWFEEKEYHKQDDIPITSATLKYWKQDSGAPITTEQITALLEYMLRESDLNVKKRGVKRK